MSTHPSFRPSRPPAELLLRTTGQVVRLTSFDGRGEGRRIVNLAADLREAGAESADVEVADLSTGGFRIICPLDLAPGATIWLKLAGFAPMKSEIIWAEDGKAGCRFCEPLYPSVLDEIVQSQPKSGVRRLFTPPAPRAALPESRAA
jgi:hypothetical protein